MVVALILVMVLTTGLTANAEIRVYVDGEKMEDIQPIVVNNRTTVPVSIIAKNLGIDYTWNNETQTVNFNQEGKELELKIGEQNSFVQGGRTYVPLKFIAETFGIEVDWRENEKAVVIGENAKNVVIEPKEEIKTVADMPQYIQDAVHSKEYNLVIPVEEVKSDLVAIEIILPSFYKISHIEAFEAVKKAIESNKEFSGVFDNRVLEIKEVDGIIAVYVGVDKTVEPVKAEKTYNELSDFKSMPISDVDILKNARFRLDNRDEWGEAEDIQHVYFLKKENLPLKIANVVITDIVTDRYLQAEHIMVSGYVLEGEMGLGTITTGLIDNQGRYRHRNFSSFSQEYQNVYSNKYPNLKGLYDNDKNLITTFSGDQFTYFLLVNPNGSELDYGHFDTKDIDKIIMYPYKQGKNVIVFDNFLK